MDSTSKCRDYKREAIVALLADIRSLDQYVCHDIDCEIDQTDVCTCGLGLILSISKNDVKLAAEIIKT